jgi:hypothetical protein
MARFLHSLVRRVFVSVSDDCPVKDCMPQKTAKVLMLVVAFAAGPVMTQTAAQRAAPAARGAPAAPPGPIVPVPAGGDLQAALDAAVPGTTLQLAPGATYTGNFLLRKKPGPGVITVRSADDAALPPGKRVSPADAGKMAKLQFADPFTPILRTEDGAHDYTIIGIEVQGNSAHPEYTSIEVGRLDMTMPGQVPTNILFDRVFVHGDAVRGGHRGLMLNVANGQVINSDVRDFFESGRDSQAIGIFNGPGPLLIQNSYVEASGENFMSGGADPKIPDLVPADLTIRGNYFYKPLAWKTAHPGSVKNLFELKNARRVTIEDNVFENCWVDAQSGHGIQFTVRNQDKTAPQSTIRDVTFQYNVVKNVSGFAINVLGIDDQPGVASVQAVNLKVVHNLFLGVGGGFQMTNGFQPSTIAHNVVLGVQGAFLSLQGKTPSLTFTSNVVAGGLYGITGDGTAGVGLPSLSASAPGHVFTKNVIEGNREREIAYPPGNYAIPAGSLAARLDRQCRYTGKETSSDGLPLGADIAALLARIPWAAIP